MYAPHSSRRRSVTHTGCALGAALSFLMFTVVAPVGAKPAKGPKAAVVKLVTDAEAARAAGDDERAEALLREAYGQQALPVIMNNLGKLLEEQGRYLEALEAYRKVTDDPDADAQLRALDRARVGALEPKAIKGWVRVPAAAAWSWGRVAGALIPFDDALDVGIPPGARLVEIMPGAGGGILRLTVMRFPRGRRVVIDPTWTDRPSGAVTLGDLVPPPSRVGLDGYPVTGYGPGVERLIVDPGPHEVRLESPNGKQIRVTATVAAGQVVDLGGLAKAPWSAIHPARAPAAASTLSPELARLLRGVTLGVGAMLAGTGLYLTHDVEQSKQYILDADRSPDLTMRDAADQWELLNTRSMVGGTLTGLGSALVMGGVVWWWLDDEAAPEVAGGVSLFWGPGLDSQGDAVLLDDDR